MALTRGENGSLAAFAYHAVLPLGGVDQGQKGSAHQLRMAWRWGVRRLPLVVAKHWHPQMPRVLHEALAAFRPDAVLVEQATMAQYLPWLRAVPSVFTDHEAGAPDRPVTDLGAWADRRDLRLWRRYVRRFYPMASEVQALTAEDAALLQRELGQGVAHRRPVVPVPATAVRPDRAPPRMLFLGDYRHHPNPEAARRIVASVLPEVRRVLPSAELLLAGPNQEQLSDLRSVPGVRLLGFARDLAELLGSARCLLAPLYSGGGFRIKVLTALAHGLPVVTNALGARGSVVPAPARIVVEDDAALAAATLRFLDDPELARQAGAQAHAWARDQLGPDAVAREQLERLARLVDAPQGERPAVRPEPATSRLP